MQKKSDIHIALCVFLLGLGVALWFLPAPQGLETKAWHVFTIFLMTILGIVTSAMPMGAITLTSIAALVLTNSLTLKESLSGFGSPIVWLVVIAFFIARGFIKTNLGKRIAYYLISKFGHTITGLSYSLISTEFLLSPMIPSTSARGGGIIFPIAKSLAEAYDGPKGKSKSGAFLMAVCFHMNVVCCALFVTAMAGNQLAVSLSQGLGATISWTDWALGAIVPGVLTLLLLPIVLRFLIKPDTTPNLEITANAKKVLAEMGRFSRDEIVMVFTFFLMLFLWIFGTHWGIDATTAAILGFLTLVVTKVLKWEEITAEKTAWETYLWFAVLLMLSEYLTKFGVDSWAEQQIRYLIGGFNGPLLIVLLAAAYFYIHYLFASVTAHITVMYATFMLLLVEAGVPLLVAGVGLGALSNLSAGLTHYGINTAPIYFSTGYFNTREWLKIGIVVASINLLLWGTVGSLWWKILGWW